MNRSLCIWWLCIFVIAGWLGVNAEESKSGKCLVCHKEKTPGLYAQWYASAHALNSVSCLDCHAAGIDDPDGFLHHDVRIATLVTPMDCGQCHTRETEEVSNSHHAKAGEILKSNDAYLAHVSGGQPVAIQGCESCHGAFMLLDPNAPNLLSPKTWPNSGIGRINPDGSKGSCNACHTRHNFSKSQARQPESCGKCHLGPDHPQKEVYEESKHGNTYYTNIDQMNLKSATWIVGTDYYIAPTCSTCHMSATPSQKLTHDVGQRISWTLRPELSQRQSDWQRKQASMKNVCNTCHGSVFVDGHFYQYDATVRLYNGKFAQPATDIMQLIRKNNLLKTQALFSNDIEWVYWELWHHEGRRGRHGAAMMGPDYTWWHGFYEVAKHFYFSFIPQARSFNHPEINQYIDNLLRNDPLHQWLNRPTADLKADIQSGAMQKIYETYFKEPDTK